MSEEMTRKGAIEYLINWDKALESQGDSPFSDARRALSYGIHSLETDEAYQLEYEQPEFCKDCISRDEVCRYVAEFVNHEFSTREEEELIDNIITGIEHMPPATPQKPRKGHWINKDYLFNSCSAECSSCHKRSNGYQHDNGFSLDFKYYDFCPNCGSDNREVVEDGNDDNKV